MDKIPQPGDKGEHVEALQKRLLAKGYKLPEYGADGAWGRSQKSETLQAVLAWQSDFYVDGLLDEADYQNLMHVEPAPAGAEDWPKVPQSMPELLEMYGKPWDDVDAWWKEWGAPVELPQPLRRLTKRGRFWANRDIVPVLESAFEQIADEGLSSHVRTYDGCFNVRKMRGKSTQWSLHSWALAIDLNAKTNTLGAEPSMNPRIVEIFTSRGFLWGGKFGRKDGMHYQRART
jgi:hypothetical protein